ncbi:MAG: M23 family metallopeptidase [Candidatus Tectomicrobia bacterium]|nr:M23 family metallopeptidase [Candidatus Tectomicrobia bacterium]
MNSFRFQWPGGGRIGGAAAGREARLGRRRPRRRHLLVAGAVLVLGGGFGANAVVSSVSGGGVAAVLRLLSPSAAPNVATASAPSGAATDSAARPSLASPPPPAGNPAQPPEVDRPAPAPAGPASEPEVDRQPRILADQTREGKIKAQETFFELLTKNGLDARRAYALIAAVKPTYNLNRVRQNQAYRVYLDRDGGFRGFEYFVDDDSVLVVHAGEQTHAELSPIRYQTQQTMIHGSISSSLFETILALGEQAELALRVADIFAWDIDFSTDVRSGDSFRLLVEKQRRGPEFSRYGDILAAEFVNAGEVYRALLFEGSKTQRGYYTPDGTSLRKVFLKSPLSFTRISSHFAARRFHPILKVYRPHSGVDYAAPYGTPVVALGAGQVEIARRKGGNGNLVRLRHADLYTTYYLHLARFAPGVRPGARVVQGQVIGYVGSTGLSTGPHLDFRIARDGRFINPLALRAKRAAPVARQDQAAFRRIAAARLKQLDDAAMQLAGSPASHAEGAEVN